MVCPGWPHRSSRVYTSRSCSLPCCAHTAEAEYIILQTQRINNHRFINTKFHMPHNQSLIPIGYISIVSVTYVHIYDTIQVMVVM